MGLRYKITLQYDGSYFQGWQLQKTGRTVQGELEKALLPFGDGERVKVIGAGRTDTGVHAWGQVAHVDLETAIDTTSICKALNATTHPSIIVESVEQVSQEFHARFSARERHYRYQVYTGDSILYRNQSWQLPGLDISHLNQLSNHLLGTHDFLSFSKVNPELDHSLCTVKGAQWKKDHPFIVFNIVGNRFLHHMVRYLVGTMVEVTRGTYDESDFFQLIQSPRKNVRIFKAPSEGLILTHVHYED